MTPNATHTPTPTPTTLEAVADTLAYVAYVWAHCALAAIAGGVWGAFAGYALHDYPLGVCVGAALGIACRGRRLLHPEAGCL